jgi:hypothetical protein
MRKNVPVSFNSSEEEQDLIGKNYMQQKESEFTMYSSKYE